MPHPVIDSDAGDSGPSLRGSAVAVSKVSSTPGGVQVEGCHLSCGHRQPLCGDDPSDDLGAAVRSGVSGIVCRRCEAAVVVVVVLQGSVVEHHQCAHVHICCCSWCEGCGCCGGVGSCIKRG